MSNSVTGRSSSTSGDWTESAQDERQALSCGRESGALVLGAGRGRVRIPWDGINDAHQITRGKTRSALFGLRSYSVPSIALRLHPDAVPSPDGMRIVRRIGDVQTLSGTTPVLLLDID